MMVVSKCSGLGSSLDGRALITHLESGQAKGVMKDEYDFKISLLLIPCAFVLQLFRTNPFSSILRSEASSVF